MIVYLVGSEAGKETAVLQPFCDPTPSPPFIIENKPLIPSYNSAFRVPKPWKPPTTYPEHDVITLENGGWQNGSETKKLCLKVNSVPFMIQISQRCDDIASSERNSEAVEENEDVWNTTEVIA